MLSEEVREVLGDSEAVPTEGKAEINLFVMLIHIYMLSYSD